MTWLLAFLGFAALVLLHEAGHFAAAKAVGMRVERFAVFFPPLLFKVRRGETEYGVGAVPLGGYVRITGMNPTEVIPPEVAHRAYFRQPVWKRITVIAAGPAVNIVLAFALLWIVFMANGTVDPPVKVGPVEKGAPAARILQRGDAILAVDGRPPAGDNIDAVATAIGRRIDASHGAPVTLRIRRDGHTLSVTGKPFYDASPKVKRWRLGFGYEGGTTHAAGPVRAGGLAVSQMWQVTSGSVSRIVRIFIPADRKQLSGVVGGYETTRQAISISASAALYVLALISLSLGVINLFPFLPLDGGHIFWALAEKVRGRAIPFATMERAGFVGFALVICLFVVGLTNDIGRLADGGFSLR